MYEGERAFKLVQIFLRGMKFGQRIGIGWFQGFLIYNSANRNQKHTLFPQKNTIK